jgi:hypothetical protein
MCDYCDCRSHAAIASLSADHERLLELVAGLRGATNDDDRTLATALVEQVHELLDGHADREERGVFTQLAAADVDAGYLEGFKADHDRIHALVDAAGAPQWRGATTELAALLCDHTAREESDLFTAAHQLLEPTQWDAVDVVHAARVYPNG